MPRMPRAQAITPSTLPNLDEGLAGMTVDQLKWYAALLPGTVPMRKADVIAMIAGSLTDIEQVRRFWAAMTPRQQEAVADAIYNNNGLYNPEVMEARHAGVAPPAEPERYFGYLGGRKKREATAFDLLFAARSELGRYVAPEVGAVLRSFVPPPPPSRMSTLEEVPVAVSHPYEEGATVEVMVVDTERVAFHDLAATLSLIQEGKISVSAATKLPTLSSVRALRQRLLLGDYFADPEYKRAEDAMRPLAFVMLAQAAKWAAPRGAAGSKLELTKSGQAVLAGPVRAEHVREAWERWVKSDLLDELSRIRSIRGQQSKDVALTKPPGRREKLNLVLRDCPVGRWVEFDEFLRYMRAEGRLPEIERNIPTGLYVGSYFEYGWLGYDGVRYWDVEPARTCERSCGSTRPRWAWWTSPIRDPRRRRMISVKYTAWTS